MAKYTNPVSWSSGAYQNNVSWTDIVNPTISAVSCAVDVAVASASLVYSSGAVLIADSFSTDITFTPVTLQKAATLSASEFTVDFSIAPAVCDMDISGEAFSVDISVADVTLSGGADFMLPADTVSIDVNVSDVSLRFSWAPLTADAAAETGSTVSDVSLLLNRSITASPLSVSATIFPVTIGSSFNIILPVDAFATAITIFNASLTTVRKMNAESFSVSANISDAGITAVHLPAVADALSVDASVSDVTFFHNYVLRATPIVVFSSISPTLESGRRKHGDMHTHHHHR